MGWQVQVVDGGLSDMYNTSHLLADNEVSIENFLWVIEFLLSHLAGQEGQALILRIVNMKQILLGRIACLLDGFS